MKGSVFIAASVDGFIARKDGRIDWLPSGDGPNGEDYGYRRFFDSVDALILGRKTFETALYFGKWPYGKKPTIVLSRRRLSIPKRLPDSVEAMSCTPKALVEALAGRRMRHLYIDGGRTIQGFLRAGLIQQITITRIPILLGDGVPLFGSLKKDVKLRHLRTRAYANGMVQTTYSVDRPAR